MTFATPVAISVRGTAELVRHLRASGSTYAVWTFDDRGTGVSIAVRRRTGTVNLVPAVGGLRTDGVDFSEKIIPLNLGVVRSFSCVETDPGVILFLVSDGQRVREFTWRESDNTVLSPPTDMVVADIPSVYRESGVNRIFYVRDGAVYLRSPTGSETEILNLSSSNPLDIDIVSVSALTSTARFAGTQLISADLALRMKPDAQTLICYDMSTSELLTTEALPPSTVSYWDMDSAVTSQIADIVGGNTGSIIGTQPTSVPGKIGNARRFTNASGYYNIGNPANLRLSGDMSLSFWIRPSDFSQRVNPYNKAYGGEGTVTIETDGYINFFYGSAGSDNNPYNGYGSIERLRLGDWQHCCVVRDLGNRVVRWYFDGQLVSSVTAHAATAAVSGNSVSIGRGYTGQSIAGDLDEIIVSSAAWGPATVSGLYAKGAAGQKANVSGPGTAVVFNDTSGASRHGIRSKMAIPTQRGSSCSSVWTPGSDVKVLSSTTSFPTPAAVTIEARMTPRGGTPADRTLFSTHIGANSSGTRLSGGMYLKLTADLRLVFGFETSTSTVEYEQVDGVRPAPGRECHLAVAHAFGSTAQTYLSVNGAVVPGRWRAGNGSETIAPLATVGRVYLTSGDEIAGLRVSSVARPISFIRQHLRGRS